MGFVLLLMGGFYRGVSDLELKERASERASERAKELLVGNADVPKAYRLVTSCSRCVAMRLKNSYLLVLLLNAF